MSGYCGPRRMPVEFVGQTTETLQQWLADAQAALQQMSIGGRPVSLSYNMGAGSKTVTYQTSDVGMLQQRIDTLAWALGIGPRRRAMRPGF